MLWPKQQLPRLQKTKNSDRKRELQVELRRVQQQIKEEQAQRQRQALDAERKVCTLPMHPCNKSGISGAGTLALQVSPCDPAKHL